MENTTRINLHCHSNFSDGELTPEALADRLALAGISYAALTDHDTVAGQYRFRERLKHHNIGFLSGIELTAWLGGREIHLLAYGFDPLHKELLSTLDFLHHARRSRTQGPLRQMPSQLFQEPRWKPAPGVAETGKIEMQEAISLVHRAGGRAFLSHPLMYESHPEALRKLLIELQAMEIDGVEGIWHVGTADEQKMFNLLADELGLYLCGGTDFHNVIEKDISAIAIDMPTKNWKQFVKLVTATPHPEPGTSQIPKAKISGFETESPDGLWEFFRPRIVLPSFVAIILFVTVIWGMVLPSIENILIERKREMIKELTNTAVSLLAAAEREEKNGQLTRSQAKEKAKAYIGALRYGKEGKDYFWIQDMHPNMIMHPYRSDLNGHDVSDFTDVRGIHLFKEFAHIVKNHQSGFVEYVWQWKDDPERLAAKESFVMGFEAWGWIIGTGMYIDDVKKEIKGIERNLVYTLTGIVGLVFMVLLYNIRQSLLVERNRKEVQENLKDAEQRYRSLVEATTEGTLLVLNHRCRYGNPTLLKMTGYSADNLELLELPDLFPSKPENEAILSYIAQLPKPDLEARSFEAVMMRSDGRMQDCLVTLNPVLFEDNPGVIALVKDVFPSGKERDAILEKWVDMLQLFNGTIGELGQPPVFCHMTVPIQEAARMMANGRNSGIVVTSDGGVPVGFLTDGDFRRWIDESSEIDQQMAVGKIMGPPLMMIPGQSMVYEALLIMKEQKVEHLGIQDTDGRMAGIIGPFEFLTIYSSAPEVLRREIAGAKTPEKAIQCGRQLSQIIKILSDAGTKPSTLARITSGICDAVTIRFIELAVKAIGPSPVKFAFIAMGSQGRQEQTLLTDQDNGIVYSEEEISDTAALSKYFLLLGSKVCEWLNQAGYPFCNGNVMANHPDWCQSLTKWKEKLTDWILRAQPQELIESSICLDFRVVYGAEELVDELRGVFYGALQKQPNFLPRLAQNVLAFKPPIRLLGKIIKTGGPRGEAGQLNIKEILMPLVGYGRLYALHHGMAHTNTLERIHALGAKGILKPYECENVAASYEFLMALRFKTQIAEIQKGKELNNCILLDDIRDMDEALLKQTFSQIESLQKKIVFDFLGGAHWPGT